MIQICNIRKEYSQFVIENKSSGFCFGFCLTWLGDILKERPAQNTGGWLSGWFTSTPTAEKKAFLPSDSARLRKLFERAARKQNNFFQRYDARDKCASGKSEYVEFTANYKNTRQSAKEKISGVSGLNYRYFERDYFRQCEGADHYRDKNVLTGVIITFEFLGQGDVRAGHAVALFRLGEYDTLFLDPNYGLFRTNNHHVMMDIEHLLSQIYKEPLVLSEVIISRRLNTK